MRKLDSHAAPRSFGSALHAHAHASWGGPLALRRGERTDPLCCSSHLPRTGLSLAGPPGRVRLVRACTSRGLGAAAAEGSGAAGTVASLRRQSPAAAASRRRVSEDPRRRRRRPRLAVLFLELCI